MVELLNEKEVRKLQLVGGSTYVLSLPKKWIDELNLKTGDPVSIVKNVNQSLSILPTGTIQSPKIMKSRTVISQKEPVESIQRKVIAMYLAGYQMLEIQSKGGRIQLEHKQAIRDLVRRNMIGTEIVGSTPESITIQILTSLPELSINDALKRMFLLTTTMHRQAIDALKEMDAELGEEITHLDDEVDRFSLYILRNLTLAVEHERILRDIGLKKPSDCISYRIVVKSIERVADHAVSIASRIKFLKSTLEPALLQKVTRLSEESLKVFEDSIAALNKRDYALADLVASTARRIAIKEKEFTDSLEESRKYTSVIKFVLEDIRRTAEYSSDIAEAVINETVQDVISETGS
ncbi:MAG TPA: phosphate uptake regulator PhoU [Candidatus Nitrosotalea sp.]|nr:phosphate uptake regulator PhoU [Candidatus Nitrosotalea sp.]